ncbi:flagellar basal body-associated protein FliL [Chryseomicrobium palamuruense]|uniref:Flagellar protein FliL n=1 Tax=Chryseomicrobium palamuruense TaxID=682973 RepID=A0ABV8UVC3_9BACL
MKKILITIVATLLVLAIGYFGYGFYTDYRVKAQEEKQVEEIGLKRLTTDTVTTNLASNEFAVIQFAIEMEEVKGREHLDHYLPEVRAAIITTMTSLNRNQVSGPEGLKLLEDTMKQAVQDIVPDYPVSRVMVTEFKVQ